MRLNHLTVHNYRRFDHLTIGFHPHLTVISARNGEGKTTVLEAAATALGSYVGSFDYGKSKNIQPSEACLVRGETSTGSERQFPVEIAAEATYQNDHEETELDLTWQRSLHGAKGHRTTSKEARQISDLGVQLQATLRVDSQAPLPAISYYSSGRLWRLHNKMRDKAILTRSRSAGYQDCLSSASSYSQLQEWMRIATLAVAQRQQLNLPDPDLGDAMAGIARSVEEVLSPVGWSSFRHDVSLDELAMTQGDQLLLPLSMLSDGVRAMVSLTADLALRCVRLNPKYGAEASKLTRGIVLIDEVDLHLHPEWQQQVLHSLTAAFPLIQFIVTTHSPQVLSTVPADQIRVITRHSTGEWATAAPVEQTLGVESGHVLGEVMGVNPVPPVEAAKILEQYTEMIEAGAHNSDGGQSLRQKLLTLYGEHHPVMLMTNRMIRFRQLKERAHSNGEK